MTVRKLLIFCLTLISFNSCADPVATSSGWILFYKNNQYGFERYYRKDSVKPDGRGTFQVSILTNFSEPTCKSLRNFGYKDSSNFCFISTIWASKMDCTNRTYQRGSVTMYQSLMAQGVSVADPYPIDTWKEISTQFPEDIELALRICNR